MGDHRLSATGSTRVDIERRAELADLRRAGVQFFASLRIL